MIRRRTCEIEGAAGFTVVELLLAALITVVITAAIFALTNPAQHIFQAQLEASDLQQRLRGSVDALHRELVMAGAGTYTGPANGPLNDFIAPILPYRAFGDGTDPSQGIYVRSDAISFLYVPSTPSQSVLAAALQPGDLDAQIEPFPNCPAPTSTDVCGFSVGDRVLIFDEASRSDIFTVAHASSGVISLQHRGALAAPYARGAVVTNVRLGTYSLKADDRAKVYQLIRHDGWATTQPVMDDVIALRFQYFGEGQPPRLTGKSLDVVPGPWTTYGPAPPPIGKTRGRWPAGENCAFVVVNDTHVSRLETYGTPIELTGPLLSDGPWCPDDTAQNRFDADLLRIRRVRVTIRLQSSLASLRGPAGPLFLKGGTARSGHRYVPDLEVQFDVTPRNLNLGR